MARVRIEHDIHDLARDMARIPGNMTKGARAAVRKNVREGNAYARSFARAASGIHGKNYYKRLTAELTGALEGEYGPHGHVVGNAVGAGRRSGPQNTDLEKSLGVMGDRFA